MEVVNLMNSIYGKFGTLLGLTWGSEIYANLRESYYQPIHLALIGVFLIALITTVLVVRRWHKKAFHLESLLKESLIQSSATRFRKRDKALFYGRKMLRKVKSISGQVRNSGQGRKRKMVMKFARRLLQLKKETETEQLKVLEPPAEYMQEDVLNDDKLPPDALYMLHSIRVFGHFEKPIFLRLCKHTEIVNLTAGSFLFKIADNDDTVYIVQSGKVNVFITGSDGSTLTLKIVKPGESVTSLLSFIDVLVGSPSQYRTVSAKAVEDSTILKLPMIAFQEIFEENPEVFIRIMQVIMVRLQRVTFTALHQYLGLSSELFKAAKKKSVVIQNVNSSPSKSRTKSREETMMDWPTTDLYVNSSSAFHTTPMLSHKRSRSGMETKIPNWTNTVNPDLVTEAAQQQAPATPDKHMHQKKKSVPDIMDDEMLINMATEAFVRDLGLDDDSILQGKIEIKEVATGTFLMKEDSIKDIALIYIISGSLIVSQKTVDNQEDEVHMFTAHSGETVGGLAVITGEPSFFTIKAKHQSRIASISKDDCYSLLKDNPKIVLHIAHMVVKRLSLFVRQVDFALDWVFLESGRAVYRQDDDSDSTFIVLSGRLRSVITQANDKREVVAEYGKGDLVGIVEMVTHTKRSTTVIAVRDSELAKLPEGLFNAIKLRFPIVVTRLINLLGHRILGSWQKPTLTVSSGQNSRVDSRPSQSNFSTVAIVPVSDDVPLTAFTYELYHCLSGIGSTLRLTSDVIRKTLGTSIMDPNNEYRLTSWLAQQEDQHKISLYQCDFSYTMWTQRCVRQADCILIVGLGANQPSLGKVEKEVERLAMRTQKELVLLHQEDGAKPHNTIAWRNMRSWVQSHHHILCPKRMFSRKSLYRINSLYSKVCMSEPNIHSDFSRLARWLTGTSVGLVLGGGGARGSAHIGMIKAIQEAGIPIDMVGGVSIGAFMGALWCQERNITTVTQKAREWSKKMTQWWRQILDLTYPMTSMFSGRDFNQTIKSTFGDTYIEDLWLPYFTITTDITASCMRIHTHGSLWRYVRSSMSLSGYMPPLCDPLDGHLLLDGGYTNNLPADVMRSIGANHILAIDVGSVDDQDLTNYGDDLSGWWLLWKRWYPFTASVKVPNLPDIQSRLAYVSCVRQLEEVKTSGYCEYIRPPIDKYRTLQFGSFDEIREVGYHHGKQYFEEQLKSGTFSFLNVCTEMDNTPQHSVYTFTDLAQMVCKVRRPYDDESSSSESSEEEDMESHGYASEPSVGILDHSSIAHRRTGGSLSLSENELETEIDFDLALRRD
ncbi:Cyclic nucleotide-binding domain [Popillia japonica]|uniref:Neuropathy target esterase sws n=1 Tax=Popillia japonica TaxID=7064 RepID=A0AAW1LUU0_POPJA